MILPLKAASSANGREGKEVWEGEWKGGQGEGENRVCHCRLINQRMIFWAAVFDWSQHQTVTVKN